MNQRQKKQAVAACFFQPPSDNTGFKYIYLSTKSRIPIGKLRNLFRKLQINNDRILDAHYPDRNIVALLFHNNYEQGLRDQLSRLKISIKDNFDPSNPIHLHDPTLKNISQSEKEQRTFQSHCSRMERALIFIREPIKYIVARYFLLQGWITEKTAQDIYRNKPSEVQASTDVFERNVDMLSISDTSSVTHYNYQDPTFDSQ
ncbi:MAG: hypothetical protein EXX96DRAFT_3830 [Benjaminiella poitrasii]|nr:MAG: hypothetical protein EXX96DRAFT_3830 [Benjaminiella poitrasii]